MVIFLGQLFFLTKKSLHLTHRWRVECYVLLVLYITF